VSPAPDSPVAAEHDNVSVTLAEDFRRDSYSIQDLTSSSVLSTPKSLPSEPSDFSWHEWARFVADADDDTEVSRPPMNLQCPAQHVSFDTQVYYYSWQVFNYSNVHPDARFWTPEAFVHAFDDIHQDENLLRIFHIRDDGFYMRTPREVQQFISEHPP